MVLVTDFPDWVRECATCQTVVIGSNGKVSTCPGTDANGDRVELPMVRAGRTDSFRDPPCSVCPKIPPGREPSPATGRELDAPAWPDVLRWFLTGKLFGFDPDTPPVLRELGRVVEAFLVDRAAREELARVNRKPVPRPALLVLNHLSTG